jgi:hypothetical protein
MPSRLADMIDDDSPLEIQSPPIAVPETKLVFWLTPTTSSIGRYTAIIAAEEEGQARRFAADADPFGAEWENPKKYYCTVLTDPSLHVVGDVVFQTMPNSLPSKKECASKQVDRP